MQPGQVALVRHVDAASSWLTPEGQQQITRISDLLFDDPWTVKGKIISSWSLKCVKTAIELGYNRGLDVKADTRLGNILGETTVLGALNLIGELRATNDAPILVTHAELAKALPIYYNDFIFGCPSFDAQRVKLLGQCGTVAIIDFNDKTVTITK